MMEEQPDCEKQKRLLHDSLVKNLPKLDPLERNRIGVFWDHLVDDITLTCLHHIELRDGGDKKLASEDNFEKTKEKKPFIQDLNICRDHSKKFHVVFFFEDKEVGLSSVKTKGVTYKVPAYFDHKVLPPYCLSGQNLTIALLQNMIKQGMSIYSHCVKQVKMCECLLVYDCDQCEEYDNEDEDGDKEGKNKMMVNRQLDNTKVSHLILTYVKVDPSKKGTTLDLRGHRINSNICYGHCDQFFVQARIGNGYAEKGTEKDSSAVVLSITGVVAFVTGIIASLGIVFSVRKWKANANPQGQTEDTELRVKRREDCHYVNQPDDDYYSVL
eukprot:GFUD01088890.1.p1 GENE.GFUD01088890.1~~GFUD01088890.1.p1  ORF type:complete len:346 (+),score=71.64 GFUD01088890.1:59-1039(+)